MRVSSPTVPSGRSGTLKSTRTKIRRPAASSVFSFRKFIVAPSGRLAQHEKRVHHAVREAPLVVVPGEDLHEAVARDHRERRVEHGGMRIADDVLRDDRILRVLEDAPK